MKKNSKNWLILLSLKVVLIIEILNLTACSPNYINNAQVSDRSRIEKGMRRTHVVEAGESLYAIAFSYGLDFRELATINNIREPYKILVGQRIYLDKKTPNTLNTKKKILDQANQRIIIEKNVNQVQNKTQNTDDNQYVMDSDWVWPINRNAINQFSSNQAFNNGIDIAVKTTTPVKAVASGKVVYQGGGLKGYGKLIIIKHSDEYLSAYAHNDWFLVNEGQWVKQGQNIAYVGQQPEKKLHFQIRKNGKPVNPLRYLPN
ncbi:MAG: peptidoglycan DD-metalloendopeptidase family protein [Gammaproteobacteria bacterium]|nr:peptidoglycan DD-metalloendopeptidase family protein [Gammaproteobacteria bacterium]